MALQWTNVPSKLQKGSPNLCRVCMCHNTKMKCVFSLDTSQTIEQFEYCTGILITKEDGLPTKMCDSCSETLAIAYKFKTSCLRSDKIFRNIIKKQNLHTNDVKIEIEVPLQPSRDLQYQEIDTKQEVLTDDDDDDGDVYEDHNDFMCNILPDIKSNTITRFKFNGNKKKEKNTKAEIKKRISKGNKHKVKSKKRVIEDAKDDLKEKSQQLFCRLCDIRFENVEELSTHRKDQHGDCEWICEICGKTFKYRASHYSHVRSHSSPTFKCPQCDYKSWHTSDMNKHVKAHKGIKDCVCEYCTRSFCTVSNLRDHIRRQHTGAARDKKHVCPRCGRGFFTSDKLRRHLDTHDNIKRFECEVCKDRFSRRCQWKSHLMKIHNISVPRLRPGRPKISDLVALTTQTLHSEK